MSEPIQKYELCAKTNPLRVEFHPTSEEEYARRMVDAYLRDESIVVKAKDHVAALAERDRLLGAYQRQHNNLARVVLGVDCGCSNCKAVDALGVK